MHGIKKWLTDSEEKELVDFLLNMARIGFPRKKKGSYFNCSEYSKSERPGCLVNKWLVE